MGIRGHGNGMEMAQFRDQQNVPSASHPAPDTDADWEQSGTGRRMNVSR